MKSIMEEASSISKAIETAWNRAGKPQEFKVKIFEEPVRNMLGFTTKPAKIAFFFEEVREQAKPTQQRPAPQAQQQQRRPVQQPSQPQQVRQPEQRPRPQQPSSHQAPAQRAPQPTSQQQQHAAPRQRPTAAWENDLIALVATWLTNTLQLMGLPECKFTTNPVNNILHIEFEAPLVADQGKERMLFSSFAHLIMLAVRHQTKRQIGNLKLVLKSK